MRLLAAPSLSPLARAVADSAAIVLFVTVGLISHHGGISATGFARDGAPILAGWFAAALALGAYRTDANRRLLLTWAVGVPLGVGTRMVILGRSFGGREAAFLATTLAFTLLFVLVLRAVVGLAGRFAKKAASAGGG